MIKKYYRYLYRAWLGKPLSTNDFIYIIHDLLGLKKGDSVLVHASFGNLKTNFSPKEAVEILMETVSDEGNLLMPYYPSDSVNWLKEDNVFDVHSTPTRSGILSATFARYPGVKKSLHPIKSLAVWGKDRDYLISTHHESTTPFDEKSPYYKLICLNGSKAIGIGVFKNSLVHASEDTIQTHPTNYSDIVYTSKVIDESGNGINVKTSFHTEGNNIHTCEYLYITKCPQYREVFFKKRKFYVSDAPSAHKHIKDFADKGITARSLKKDQSIYRNIKSKINRI